MAKELIKDRLFLKKLADSYVLHRIKDGILTIEGDAIYNIAGIEPFYKLSLKNCQSIELGYDLDNCVDYFEKGKLYIQQDGVIILAGENGNNGIIIQDPLGTRGVGHYSDEWNPKAFCEFKQKALELMGDKKFSEEDMKSFAQNYYREIRENTSNLLWNQLADKCLKEHIQSLQQSEWLVEIEMEKIEPYKDKIGNVRTEKTFPKLDADGCLILKRAE